LFSEQPPALRGRPGAEPCAGQRERDVGDIRKPSADESSGLLKIVGEAKDRHKTLEDVYWAVLNSKEFVFNH